MAKQLGLWDVAERLMEIPANSRKFRVGFLNNCLNIGHIFEIRPCLHWTRCSERGYRMGIFALSSRSADS